MLDPCFTERRVDRINILPISVSTKFWSTWIECSLVDTFGMQFGRQKFWLTLVRRKGSSTLIESIQSRVGQNRCQAMWPDLAKIRHFGKSQVFCNSLTVYFLFGKMLSILCQICDIIGLIFIVSNGQILKNNLTILSHWCQDNHLIIAFPSCSLFDGFDLTKEINLFYVQHKQSSWK